MPWVWVLTVFTLSVVMLAGLLWHVQSIFQVTREVAATHLQDDQLGDMMMNVEWRLPMTTLLLDTPQGRDRLEHHHEAANRLLQALDLAILESRESYTLEGLRQARDAIEQINHIEAEAIRLANDGNVDEALSLLQGDEYVGWQLHYSEVSRRMVRDYLEVVADWLARQSGREVRAIGIAIAIVLLCLTIWTLLVRRVRQWSDELHNQYRARQRLETRLIESEKMEAVGRLASGVAHDFSNQLTAIRGYAGLAREQLKPGDPAGTALGCIEEAADQAEAVTHGLLAFSRKSLVEQKAVELGRLVQTSSQWLRQVVPYNIDLKTSVSKDADLWVLADGDRLRQALMNLVLNGCEAMPDGGRLIVSTGTVDDPSVPGGSPAVLAVRDTGVGMPDEVKTRALEPFFTTKSRDTGTGLGLAIVHGVVKQQGGRIKIRTSQGSGTTVEIRLPTIPAPIESHAELLRDEHRYKAEGLVLLSEPHPYASEFMVSALESAGLEVRVAVTDQELMDIYTEEGSAINLLVMACDHPDSSRLKCLESIRSAGYTGPAIVILPDGCSEPEESDDRRVMWLNKPLRVAELRRIACQMVSEPMLSGDAT